MNKLYIYGAHTKDGDNCRCCESSSLINRIRAARGVENALARQFIERGHDPGVTARAEPLCAQRPSNSLPAAGPRPPLAADRQQSQPGTVEPSEFKEWDREHADNLIDPDMGDK